MNSDELSKFNFKINVSMVDHNGSTNLEIKESFVMPRGEILIKLPSIFLRTEKLYDRISNLKASDNVKISVSKKDPSLLLIEHEKGKLVEFSYHFSPSDPRNYPQKQEHFSAPIIRDDYFQFVGLMALAYPLPLVGVENFPIEMTWDLPSGFQVFNSFGAGNFNQSFTTDFDKLRDALFVAGNSMRTYNINVRNQPVIITLEGDWTKITDSSFVDTIQRLLITQRETWQDDDFPYFFINILSNPQVCAGNIKFAGTAHTNSFRAFFPSGCSFMPEMKQLISHELMHMWIGKKIKVGKERGHIDGKWFTEGWNDYFGRLLAYNAGVLTEKEYFDSLNRQLEKYSVSTENQRPLEDLVSRMYKREYSNRDLEDVPYQQGEIMALNLNKIIEQSSGFKYSLKSVIREMLAQAKKSSGVKNFTVSEIAQIVDDYDAGASNTFNTEYQKIEKGELLFPPNLDGCRMVQMKTSGQYVSAILDTNSVLSYGPPMGSCAKWLK